MIGDYMEILEGNTMETTIENEFRKSFKAMQTRIHQDNVAKGFWDGERNDGETLMLVVSELSEALEYLRKGNGNSDHIPNFTGVEEEMADVVIRVMDFCEERGHRLSDAIIEKLAYNRTRPFKHGKKF